MSLMISERCVQCGACEWECPNEAIHPGDPRPVIEPDRCTECLGFFADSQCAVVCPVDAITKANADSSRVLMSRYLDLHPGRPTTNAEEWVGIGETLRRMRTH